MAKVRLHRPLTRKLRALRPLYQSLGSLPNPRPKAPKGYSVEGARVEVMIGREYYNWYGGVIERQIFAGARALFFIRLKKRIPFGTYSHLVLGDEKTPRKQNDLYWEMKRIGCVTPVGPPEGAGGNHEVRCLWARWQDLRIPMKWLRKGQPIEIVNDQGADFPVRFIKRIKGKRGRILVWLPEPLLWYDISRMHDWTLMRPEWVSKHSYIMDVRAYDALAKFFKESPYKLPPVRSGTRKHGRDNYYEFKEPVPLREMSALIRVWYKHMKKGDPGLTPRSIWGSLLGTVLYHMVVIDTQMVSVIRPMREDLFEGLVMPVEAAMEGL